MEAQTVKPARLSTLDSRRNGCCLSLGCLVPAPVWPTKIFDPVVVRELSYETFLRI